MLFVLFPLLILTGLALSPGVDAAVPWLTAAFGGRQFARLWHFALMVLLLGYFATHLVLVLDDRRVEQHALDDHRLVRARDRRRGRTVKRR